MIEKGLSNLLKMLLIVSVALIAFNQFMIYSLNNSFSATGDVTKRSTQMTGDAFQDAVNIVIPTGKPDIYADELGVSFDDPVNSMNKMAAIDPTYGKQKIDLTSMTAEQKQRYIKIGTTPTIACEFCCGAKTLVNSEGNAACGCAHSQAMRGLAAYLITKHPEVNDDVVMREVAKWKALYFPKDMITKFMEQSKSGKYTPDMAALLSGMDKATVEKFASNPNIPSPSEIKDVPGMVGGC